MNKLTYSLLNSDSEPDGSSKGLSKDPVISLFAGSDDPDAGLEADDGEPFILSNAAPESMAETIRKSGLAWSAGIAFFASVVFMLVIGWGADLLFGSSPWGIVGGILIGSIIGFVQFFRITSQIFQKNEPPGSTRTLLSDEDGPGKPQ